MNESQRLAVKFLKAERMRGRKEGNLNSVRADIRSASTETIPRPSRSKGERRMLEEDFMSFEV